MRIPVAETLKWIRENHPVPNPVENPISHAERRQAGGPSHRIAAENFDENFNTRNKVKNRRPRKRYKAVAGPKIDLLEDFILTTQPQDFSIPILPPAPTLSAPSAPPIPRRSDRLQYPKLPKPGPPGPPSILSEEDRLRWKEARRQRCLFERDFPHFNRACTKAKLQDQFNVEDPEYLPLDQPDRSPTPSYSTDESIPEPPSDTELYGLQVTNRQHA